MSEQIVAAFDAQNWYALAALILFCLVQAWRHAPIAREVWKLIPDGWRWLPPILVAGGVGFSSAWAEGAEWRIALLRAVATMVYVGLPAMGLHATLKEAGSQGLPSALQRLGTKLKLFLLSLGLFVLSGCMAAKPVARTVHDVAKDLCAVYYGDVAGLSVEDAARTFCSTERQLRPWLDAVLRASGEAAAASADSRETERR